MKKGLAQREANSAPSGPPHNSLTQDTAGETPRGRWCLSTITPRDRFTRDVLHVVLRVGCVGLVFACNAVMWTFFAKALHYSSSSATATVTTTASNFVSSAFLGKLLFGETRALLWWIGISVTLCGLLLLHTASPQTEQQHSVKKDK
uniref:Transmembrane protein 42 n=1 Tax=Chelydra serpentina TaxID=8475 RepID=A0A8C3SJA2_CHESE